jgi:hypothetical protein
MGGVERKVRKEHFYAPRTRAGVCSAFQVSKFDLSGFIEPYKKRRKTSTGDMGTRIHTYFPTAESRQLVEQIFVPSDFENSNVIWQASV